MSDIGPTHYGNCDCYVWLLSSVNRVGRCGRCGVQPEGWYSSKEEAMESFQKEHSKLPEPIGRPI